MRGLQLMHHGNPRNISLCLYLTSLCPNVSLLYVFFSMSLPHFYMSHFSVSTSLYIYFSLSPSLCLYLTSICLTSLYPLLSISLCLLLCVSTSLLYVSLLYVHFSLYLLLDVYFSTSGQLPTSLYLSALWGGYD